MNNLVLYIRFVSTVPFVPFVPNANNNYIMKQMEQAEQYVWLEQRKWNGTKLLLMKRKRNNYE